MLSLVHRSYFLSALVRHRVVTTGILNEVVRRRVPARLLCLAASKRGYSQQSFIHQVLDQVQKEVELNPSLKQSVEELRETKSQLSQSLGAAKTKVSEIVQKIAESQQNATLHPAFSALATGLFRSLRATQRLNVFLRTQLDAIHDVFAEDKKSEIQQKLEIWKRQKAEKAHAQKRELTPNDVVEDDVNSETALVVMRQSMWDKFGVKIQDMPFLKDFFTYGPINKLFGETAQAAAFKEMKALDPSFKLSDLVDLVQYFMCYHIVDAYMSADEEVLRLHCGEALFAAMKETIRARQQNQIVFDPTILILRDVEFRTASCVMDSAPWFIFTFKTQQINCMRHAKTGKILGGSENDIREVMYSMAIRKHPQPNLPSLEYPWQIVELAIIGDTGFW